MSNRITYLATELRVIAGVITSTYPSTAEVLQKHAAEVALLDIPAEVKEQAERCDCDGKCPNCDNDLVEHRYCEPCYQVSMGEAFQSGKESVTTSKEHQEIEADLEDLKYEANNSWCDSCRDIGVAALHLAETAERDAKEVNTQRRLCEADKKQIQTWLDAVRKERDSALAGEAKARTAHDCLKVDYESMRGQHNAQRILLKDARGERDKARQKADVWRIIVEKGGHDALKEESRQYLSNAREFKGHLEIAEAENTALAERVRELEEGIDKALGEVITGEECLVTLRNLGTSMATTADGEKAPWLCHGTGHGKSTVPPLPVCPKCGNTFTESMWMWKSDCDCYEVPRTEWLLFCAKNTPCRECGCIPYRPKNRETLCCSGLRCWGNYTPVEWLERNKEDGDEVPQLQQYKSNDSKSSERMQDVQAEAVSSVQGDLVVPTTQQVSSLSYHELYTWMLSCPEMIPSPDLLAEVLRVLKELTSKGEEQGKKITKLEQKLVIAVNNYSRAKIAASKYHKRAVDSENLLAHKTQSEAHEQEASVSSRLLCALSNMKKLGTYGAEESAMRKVIELLVRHALKEMT